MTARHPAGNPRRVSPHGREPGPAASGRTPLDRPKASRPRRSPPASAAPWWRHPAWIAGLAALALYLPTLAFGFVRDDHELIAENPFLRRAGWLLRLLGSDYWASSGGDSGLWRPLVSLSYWLDGRLGGWSAGWFHGVNAVLHAVTTAVVVVLASQRGRSRAAALIAGLWFAAMPVHAESVAWISGRTDVLCALAFGLALWADRSARERGARWPGGVAVLAFALALLAKEAALPLVLAFAVAERVEREGGRVRLSWLTPYAVVAALYLVAHQAIARGAGIPAWLDGATLARRHWAGWTMLPEDLAFFWPWFPHAAERQLALPASVLAPAVLAGAGLTLAAFATLVWLAWRRAPAALPLALFLLPLTPPIGLAIARGYVAHAERLLYVSSIGAAWLLALALDRAERTAGWRVPARVLGLALVAASAWATVRVLPDWRSDATMYASMVRAQPSHVEGRIGLASTLLDQGRTADATAQLDAAERLEPRHPALQVTRALAALRSDDWPVVLDRARRARAVDPARTDAALLEAQALVRLDRRAEADRALDSLLARSPGLPQAEALQGELRLAQGRPAEAAERLRSAAGWMPGDPAIWRALGTAELESGRPGPARDALRRAATLAPNAYSVWLQLAWASHLAGDAVERDAALDRAAQLPGAADGRADSLRRRFASVPSGK